MRVPYKMTAETSTITKAEAETFDTTEQVKEATYQLGTETIDDALKSRKSVCLRNFKIKPGTTRMDVGRRTCNATF